MAQKGQRGLYPQGEFESDEEFKNRGKDTYYHPATGYAKHEDHQQILGYLKQIGHSPSKHEEKTIKKHHPMKEHEQSHWGDGKGKK